MSSNIWLTSPVLMGNLISNMMDGLIKDMTAITDFFKRQISFNCLVMICYLQSDIFHLIRRQIFVYQVFV